jgi:hypothetical protein
MRKLANYLKVCIANVQLDDVPTLNQDDLAPHHGAVWWRWFYGSWERSIAIRCDAFGIVGTRVSDLVPEQSCPPATRYKSPGDSWVFGELSARA